MIIDETYRNTEEYLQFVRAHDDPREEQEMYDLMRLDG